MLNGRSLMSSMFSQPMMSLPSAPPINLAYRGVTLTTFDESRLIVLAMTAPQPSLNARLMTFRLVPGGPEPMTKGFGSFNPSTVVASVGIRMSLFRGRPILKGHFLDFDEKVRLNL